MISMSEKLYQIVESSNQTKGGELSLFLLDPLLTQVSIYCQVTGKTKEMEEDIEKMETICNLHNIEDGTHLLHSAYTMRAITFLREDKIKEALELLEKTYMTQYLNLK
jgi:hypothetical protein